MYLFQYLPYAESKVFEWIADERDMYQLCGFLTVARLLLKGTQFCPRTENELLDQCRSAIASENKAVSKAAYNTLFKYSQQDELHAKTVERILKDCDRELL